MSRIDFRRLNRAVVLDIIRRLERIARHRKTDRHRRYGFSLFIHDFSVPQFFPDYTTPRRFLSTPSYVQKEKAPRRRGIL